jgi:hypothetical protein
MNPHRGEVPLTIGGQQFTLRCSVNAICTIEEQMGKGIVAIVMDLQRGNISLTLIRAMLWAMLQEKHPDVTLMEAGEMIPLAGGVDKIKEVFEDAFATAFPEAAERSGMRPPKPGRPKNGTGPVSSKRGAASAETQTRSGDERPARST